MAEMTHSRERLRSRQRDIVEAEYLEHRLRCAQIHQTRFIAGDHAEVKLGQTAVCEMWHDDRQARESVLIVGRSQIWSVRSNVHAGEERELERV